MLQANPGVQYPHCEPPASASPACTGCSASGEPSPSAVTISWPSSAATGTRQAFTAVHAVPPSSAGVARSMAQAPHSPSAQPSLLPVSPFSRSHSRAVVCAVAFRNGRRCPLTVTAM